MAKARISKVVAPVQTVAAPASAPAPAPAVAVLAPITADLALQVATQYVALVVATEAASVNFVAQTRLIASQLGSRLTYAQFASQLLPVLKEAFKGSDLSEARVSEFCSRFRVIACAALTGDVALAPLAGETRDKYVSRIRPLLDVFRFADDVPMMAPSVTGKASSKRGRKPGSKASNAKAPAAPASAAKADDTGHDVSRGHAAAVSLMGSEEGGKVLLAILSKHRKAFDDWAKTTLAMASDKPVTRPATPEPTRDDKAINAQILAMANASKATAAKANGKAN